MSKPEDIRRYLPDVATAMKAADEKAAADRHRKALESAPPPVPVVAAPPVTAPIEPEPATSGHATRRWTPSKRTAAVLAVLGVAIPVLIQAFLQARTPVVAESRPPAPSTSALGGPPSPSPSSLPLPLPLPSSSPSPSPSPIRSVESLQPSPPPTDMPLAPPATATPTITPSVSPKTAPKPPKPTGPIAPPASTATSAPTTPPPPPDPKFVE
jgi:hypothetical protein